jgi:hypothetical protein
MIVLLHCDNPWDIVESDGSQPEVGVIRNLIDFLDETIEIMCSHTIDSRNKISRRKAILIRW